jgi:hypothetical protein
LSIAVKVLLIVGLPLLILGPCAGAWITLLGIQETYDRFRLLGETGDPAVFSASIAQAFDAAIYGVAVGGAGGVLVLVGLILHIATRPGRGQSLPPQATPLTP